MTELTREEQIFLERYETRPFHLFREVERYALLLGKLEQEGEVWG